MRSIRREGREEPPAPLLLEVDYADTIERLERFGVLCRPTLAGFTAALPHAARIASPEARVAFFAAVDRLRVTSVDVPDAVVGD